MILHVPFGQSSTLYGVMHKNYMPVHQILFKFFSVPIAIYVSSCYHVKVLKFLEGSYE